MPPLSPDDRDSLREDLWLLGRLKFNQDVASAIDQFDNIDAEPFSDEQVKAMTHYAMHGPRLDAHGNPIRRPPE